MFREIFLTTGTELVQYRLDNLNNRLRGLTLPTRDELQATVISALNAVLAIATKVSPLRIVRGETPAVAGDVSENMLTLNEDAVGIMLQLFGLENEAAHLFNLVASTQNSLRQKIREQVYLTTRRRYLETFINEAQLVPSTASFDFGVGMATTSFVQETEISPQSIGFGVGSVGAIDALSSLANLSDGLAETSLNWTGDQVELVVTFANPHDYQSREDRIGRLSGPEPGYADVLA